MKQKLSWIFVLVLILIVSLVSVTGCSKKKAVETKENQVVSNTGKSSDKESPSSEKVKLEITMVSGSSLPAPEDDFVKQELDKALNLDVNLTPFPSTDEYLSQLNVRLIGGNVPDIIYLNSRDTLIKLSQQDMLLDLSEYKDQIPSSIEFIGNQYEQGLVNGVPYALVKAAYINYNSYWIRKDWLDNLGLEVPKTLDEFKEIARAFTEDDPDGNNADDTFGLSGGGMNTFGPIFGAFNVGKPGDIYIENGNVVQALYEPEMKEALASIKSIIDDGVVDPELMVNKGSQWRDKTIQGKVGIVMADWPNIKKSKYVEQQKDINPNAEWIQIEAPVGPYGSANGTYDDSRVAGMYAIPAKLADSPERLDAVLRLLEYLGTREGSLIVQYGVKGRHFNLEGDKVVPTELMSKEVGYSYMYQLLGRPEEEYLGTKFAHAIENIKFAKESNYIKLVESFVDRPEFFNSADADRYIEEETTKFIYGQRPLSEYDDFIKTLNSTFKYKQYMEEAEKQLKQKGIIE